MQQQPHVEVELKLRVPPGAVDGVEAALRIAPAGGTPVDIDLEAHYHDTTDWQLSRAGFAWRMRREGDRWVQALKARIADDDTQRFEHEVDAGPVVGSEPPPLDATRHTATAIGARFVGFLTGMVDAGAPPTEQFRVLVHRLERVVTNEFGTVAVALDRGSIVAGVGSAASSPSSDAASITDASNDRPTTASMEVCEVEFELVSGTVEAVRAEAARWADRFGLVADLPNKARRGRALADAVRRAHDGVGTPSLDR